ncbi:hypothetical protein [Mycolicibacterium aubagnense]|uniref:Uncharacterized protein n=1 Tax=Mycolicibacterium aubagnense TaxID=319707 RepID=A0ABM7I6Q0_9MYCO|nr:hypothetical protein [Mycolicibacterium aubagnense]TLH48980.1 hypothetical protein C1S80_29295 [Mycolicibacterium aubagnense]BBX82234.1 hypothetical protein MAUB_01070 [Mycolicibacterium aubagnense]
MKYPTDCIDDDYWRRIHQGHGLDRDKLIADLDRNGGIDRHDHEALIVEEVWMALAPRVKHCANYGFPCPQEGEWHAHWYSTQTGSGEPFTLARWGKAEAATV